LLVAGKRTSAAVSFGGKITAAFFFSRFPNVSLRSRRRGFAKLAKKENERGKMDPQIAQIFAD
jgi:hypothetical protein